MPSVRTMSIYVTGFALFMISQYFYVSKPFTTTHPEIQIEPMPFGYHVDLSSMCEEGKSFLECFGSPVNHFDHAVRSGLHKPE